MLHFLSTGSRHFYRVRSDISCCVSVYFKHPWAHSRNQQTVITVYRLPSKENKLSFSVSSIFCIYTVYRYIYCIFIFASTYLYLYIYRTCCCFKRKMEAQAIFLDPFIVCSSCKWKLVVCPFIYVETNRSYPFANGLNGLAHLWCWGGGGV